MLSCVRVARVPRWEGEHVRGQARNRASSVCARARVRVCARGSHVRATERQMWKEDQCSVCVFLL